MILGLCQTEGCFRRIRHRSVPDTVSAAGRTHVDGKHCWRCRQREDRRSGTLKQQRYKLKPAPSMTWKEAVALVDAAF